MKKMRGCKKNEKEWKDNQKRQGKDKLDKVKKEREYKGKILQRLNNFDLINI